MLSLSSRFCSQKALRLLLPVLMLVAATDGAAQNWNQLIKAAAGDHLVTSVADREVNDNFGYSVAISGDYAIVGIPYDDHTSRSINAGAAYIFKQTAGVWAVQQKLVAADRTKDAYFGTSVAISGDYAIVGSPSDDFGLAWGNPLTDAGAVYIFKQTAGVWAQQQKLVAADRAANDKFGTSVSISGNYAIVGAYLEDEDVAGSNTMADAGSVYIFKQTAGTWAQQQKLVASDRTDADYFGFSVSINGDYAIVGAYQEDQDALGGFTMSSAGSAYIFKQTAGVWAQQQKIVATNRGVNYKFGYSVSISGDYTIIGSESASAYIFHQTAGVWAQQINLNTGGSSVSINGDFAIAGNYKSNINYEGAASIFKQTAGVWTLQQAILASDRASYDNFGYSVAISGDYVISGALNEDHDATGGNSLTNAGSAYVFKQMSGTWAQQQKIVHDLQMPYADEFGYSVAISGDYAIVGAYNEGYDASGGNYLANAGAVYIFKQTAGVWAQQQKLVASDRAANGYFGISVSVSGDYAIVASSPGGGGAVYIFKQTTGVWVEQQIIDGASSFGYSVSILNGNYAVIGYPSTNTGRGAVYIYKPTAGIWNRQQIIYSSDPDEYDLFGNSVSISGDYIIVGAYQDDENAAGSLAISQAGAAFIFKQTSGTWTQQQKIVASDRAANNQFGYSVSISGDFAIVGSPSPSATGGAAYIFKQTAGVWAEQQKVTGQVSFPEDFGHSVSISGDYAIVGAISMNADAPRPGYATIYGQSAGTWLTQANITASDGAYGDDFGNSVSISGYNVIAGAPYDSEDAPRALRATSAMAQFTSFRM